MQLGRIDVNKLRGVVDKAMGLGKESFGVLIGNDRLERAGEARQVLSRHAVRAPSY